MSSSTVTAGSVTFAAVVRRVGAAEEARKLRRTPGAVSNWAAGRRKPTEAVRKAILEAHGIELASWDQPVAEDPPGPVATVGPQDPALATASDPAPPSPPVAAAPPVSVEAPGVPPAPSAPADAMRVAEETVQTLRDELTAPTPDQGRVKVSTALTGATRLLAKMSGAIEITPGQILRSNVWRQVRTAIVDAARPWPDALDAIAKVLQRLDEQGGIR